ncbi:MAG: Ig-like domain-containing protein [Bacteroidales bacterium]|nr:Ig-like domain-containing protein [Bacteroidales bacterium]
MKNNFILKLFAWGTALACVFVFSACNGKDQDLIDSITGKTVVPVTGISLDKASLELKVGDSKTLTATVAPEDATNKNVSWTSGDATIATVENCRVTGVKPGSVTITAKTEDGGMTAECAVTVKTNLAPSVTVGSEHISAVSVVLKGEANLDAQMSSDMTMGIMWSENSGVLPSNSTKIEAKNIEAKEGSTTSYCYSVNLTGLDPAKTYYFRSYVTQNSQDAYGETKSFTTKSLSSLLSTLDATDIAPTSARMNAKLDLTDVQYGSLSYGFYWGTSEESQTTYVKGGEVAKDAYSALLNNLSHKTQYWYKAYLKVDSQEFYGAVKSFTTDVVPVTGVSLDKTACTVHTIDSTFTLIPTILPSDATDKAVRWDSSNPSVATVDDNGKVTAKGNGSATITVTTDDQGKTATCEVTVAQWVTGITLNKSSVLLIKGQMETVSLTPTVFPSNASDKSVTWSSSNSSVATVSTAGEVTAVSKGTATIKATANDGSGKSASCEVAVYDVIVNLSANGSANCYVVSSAGDYFFSATKGNSDTSVGSVSSVSVLWESYGTSTTPSVGSIINNVSYSGNTITFSTPATLKNGNAVIAAKDASGNVLWSWHIWVCAGYNPASTAQEYYNSAGTMMDRNLGATSATPGNVGSLGLLYQWGRKDPFLGSSSISSGTKAKSTLSWPAPVSSTSNTGAVDYAVAHPTTFITGITGVSGTNNDWVFSSRDNTLWQSAKTIYDPCPPGWKVPAGGSSGVWSKAANTSSKFSRTWDYTNKGMNFSNKFGSAGTIWYPAAGSLLRDDGSLGDVGSVGLWWSCTPDGSLAYVLDFYDRGGVSPSGCNYRAFGQSVRCLQE